MPNFSLCTCVCVHQAEARLAAKRAARAEAREIRMRELERQQKEVKTLQMFVAPVASTTTAVHNKEDFLTLFGTAWAVWTNVSCHISLCSSGGGGGLIYSVGQRSQDVDRGQPGALLPLERS